MQNTIIALVALFAISCNSPKHKDNAHAKSSYLVTNPLVKDIKTHKEYVCQIQSIQHIEIRVMEKGYLSKIHVDEGQHIKKGQLMFEIMPTLYKAEAKKAEAEAEYSKIEYLTTKSLADSSIVSQNELALAKARYDRALAELDLAKIHLNFTEIRAPFDGIMGRFHARIGSLLDEGELLTELSDNSKVWVYFNVPEAEYLDYSEQLNKSNHQEVELLMANNKFFPHPGVIETIESDFNNETGNIAFRACFPNPNGLLRHGETGNILIPSISKDALLIPQKSTFEILDKKYIYVVNEKKVVESRQIEIDQELPHIYSVKNGLSVDDNILVDGIRKVRNGDKILCEKVQAAEILSKLDLDAE